MEPNTPIHNRLMELRECNANYDEVMDEIRNRFIVLENKTVNLIPTPFHLRTKEDTFSTACVRETGYDETEQVHAVGPMMQIRREASGLMGGGANNEHKSFSGTCFPSCLQQSFLSLGQELPKRRGIIFLLSHRGYKPTSNSEYPFL